MADVITGDAQVANTKMELILALVQRELAGAAKLLPTVTDVTRFAEKGVDQISFPNFGSFSVNKKVSGTAVDAQTLGDSVDTLTLSEHAVIQCPKCQELFSIDNSCPAFHDVLDLEKNNFDLFSDKEKFDYTSKSHPD